MKNLRRRLICLAICMVFVFSSAVFAFAHPTTADTFADAMTAGWTYDNSGLGAPYGKDMSTSWYQIFGKNALSMLRDVRYQLTGTDYDNHSGTSLYTYVNNIYSTLTNTGSGSILYGINQTNTKLSDIYTSVGVGGSGNNVLTKLSALINAVGDISIPDLTSYVSNIDTGVTTINTDGVKLTGNALNRLNQIAGYTSWISTIRDTTERIEGINTTISAISADTNSKLSSFNDDYNNINWVNNGNYIDVRKNQYNSQSVNAPDRGNNFYVTYRPVNISSDNIYYIRLPLYLINAGQLQYDYDIKLYVSNSSRTTIYPSNGQVIAYSMTYDYIDIIANIPMYMADTNYIVVNVTSTGTDSIYYRYGINTFIKSVDISSKDFYDVQNYVYNFNFMKLLRQAKEMFFDDESLQAKRNNASQTSAVLTNYTGSGSASASASDFGSLKDGVTTVKSGLNTNVSVSNVFSLFNSSDGFDFWTSETLSELNTVSVTRRSGSDTPLYDSRLSEILNLMEVNDR